MNRAQVLSCREANRQDLVDYLAHLGHQPQKITGMNYWYCSPLREERTPSFKVDRRLNLWYDFGSGRGGTLVDFGILYHRCSVSEWLRQHSSFPVLQQSPATIREGAALEREPSRLTVVGERAPTSLVLLRYLRTRRIPQDIAERYLREVDYELAGRRFSALGFANRSGGFELRSPTFKGSSAPKDITLVDRGVNELSVFEGFFDLLSYLALERASQLSPTNLLVLNSTAFFDRSLPLMESYQKVHLFLDRDRAGEQCTQKALSLGSRYQDRSALYQGYKDLNDWTTSMGKGLRSSLRITH